MPSTTLEQPVNNGTTSRYTTFDALEALRRHAMHATLIGDKILLQRPASLDEFRDSCHTVAAYNVNPKGEDEGVDPIRLPDGTETCKSGMVLFEGKCYPEK